MIPQTLLDELEGRSVLDTVLMNETVCAGLYCMIKDAQRYTFILAGAFGRAFLSWMNLHSKPYAGYLLYPDGLGDGMVRAHSSIYLSNPNTWNAKACFVDAWIHSGATRLTAIHQLMVSKEVETYVAYDGMPEQQDWCHSLYRQGDKEG